MNRNPQNISLIRAIKGDGTKSFSSADQMRARFSTLMSEMYRREVPQYGKLLDLVADINDRTLRSNSILRAQMERTGELQRLHVEQHGAIRLGTAAELAWIRRMFAVMGMFPVGYYDLSVAGVPVHSTAFRPIEDRALKANPFRVFTSLLRLDLISDPELQSQARTLLERRRIFSERLLELIVSFEPRWPLQTPPLMATQTPPGRTVEIVM